MGDQVGGSDTARRQQLGALLSHFPPTIVAFAYGSGVFAQRDTLGGRACHVDGILNCVGRATGRSGFSNGYARHELGRICSPSFASTSILSTSSAGRMDGDGNGMPCMPGKTLDLIFGVDNLGKWLEANMVLNPSHYPVGARIAGPQLLALLACELGSGVKYHVGPKVRVGGVRVKYGVVQMDVMKSDLQGWDTLHLSGRMQKPVVLLKWNADMASAQYSNLERSLGLARILLPEQFSEFDLWRKTTELSYRGDVRTYFNAEDPLKAPKIVHGTGFQLFRDLYAPVLHGVAGKGLNHVSTGVTLSRVVVDGSISGWRFSGFKDDLMLKQDKSLATMVKMFCLLPIWMLSSSAQSLGLRRATPTIQYLESLTPGIRREAKMDLAGTLLRRHGTGVVAATLVQALSAFNLRSSLRQATFGILTAGPAVAWSYGLRKLRKGSGAHLRQRMYI